MHGIDKKAAARQARNEYQREWRKANKDKVKEYNQKYWVKKYENKIKGELENMVQVDEQTHRGIIVSLKTGKGYGFIDEGKGDKDIFFHACNVIDKKYNNLVEGMEVEFLIDETGDGLKAISVGSV